MHTIFVMIKCELGQTYKTAAMIADQVDEAAEVYSTSGGYDLLAKFHLDKDQDIGRFVTERIQPKVRAICEKYGIPYVQESVWTRARKMVDIVVGKSTMRRLSRREGASASGPIPEVA